MSEMDPQVDKQKAIDTAVHKSRDDRGHRILYVLVGVAVLGVVYLFLYAFMQKESSDELATQVGQITTEQAQAAADAQKLAAQLRGLGVRPTVTPPTPMTGQQGQPGPGPTQAQIDASVNAYFATHPLPAGQLPPVSEVAGLVANYLSVNPPAPGANATPQMVADAVTSYCSANSGCTGPAGQNATDSQVATEVATYCAAHNNCAGPAGTNGTNGQNGADGPQGVSVTDVVFQRDASGCEAVITLFDPATGKTSQVTHPAGAAACPIVTPTTTSGLLPGVRNGK